MTQNTDKGHIKKENSSSTLDYANQRQEFDLASDIRLAMFNQAPRGGRAIVWSTLVLVIILMCWMSYFEIEEVTSGVGEVVPLRRSQVVQNLERGVLEESLVRAGDIVQKGQPLLRLDEARFVQPQQEPRVKYLALTARAARLKAETSGEQMTIPDVVGRERPDLVQRERQLYISRQRELDTDITILQEQKQQMEQELLELKAKLADLEKNYSLFEQEIKLTRPLLKQGVVSGVEVLRLERQALSMAGEIRELRLSISRVQSRLTEADKNVQKKKLEFANTAKEELNSVEVELEAITSSAAAADNRLKSTVIRSPIHGIVKQVLVTTEGTVIQPRTALIEVVALEETLLVETRIKPSDIAFLRPGQRATLRFPAYDFTVYTGLEAEVEHISTEFRTDEQGNSFYPVRLRSKKNYLEQGQGKFPIIPGMVAKVSIVTGKKTVMRYLLTPVLRAKEMALRER